MNVTMEMNQVLIEQVTCFTSIWNKSSGHDFLEFNYFVTDGSFTADGGAKVCKKWLQGKVIMN